MGAPFEPFEPREIQTFKDFDESTHSVMIEPLRMPLDHPQCFMQPPVEPIKPHQEPI